MRPPRHPQTSSMVERFSHNHYMNTQIPQLPPSPSFIGSLTTVPTTLTFILVNVVGYLVQVAKGVHWLEPANLDLMDWGANVSPLTLYGESWRLLSSMFLHGGVVHLLMNMYMLLVMGMLLERRFGSVRTFAVYMTAGVMGSLLSVWWNSVHMVSSTSFVMGYAFSTTGLRVVVSVGASGAVMGLAGALLVTAMRRHADEKQPAELFKPLAQVVGLNIVLGFVLSGVDQAAHIGGVLAGCLAGGLLLAESSRRLSRLRGAGTVVVVVAGIAAYASAAHFSRSPALDQLHESLLAEMVLEHQAAQSVLRKKQADLIAAEDSKNAPPPVAEALAKGTQVSLVQQGDQLLTTMALSPNEKHVYAPDMEGNRLLVASLDQASGVRTISAAPLSAAIDGCLDNLCRGRGASAVAVSSDEQTAYITSMQKDALALVDLSSGKVEANVPVGRFPRAVVLAPNAERAFVMNSVDNTISVVDTLRHTVVGEPMALQGGNAEHLPFGRRVGLWVDAAHERLYAYDGVAKQVEAISMRTMQREATLSIPNAGVELAALSLDSKVLMLIGGRKLQILSTKTHTVERETALCEELQSRQVALSPDGSLLALPYDGKLRIVKLESMRTVAAFPIQEHITELIFSADSRQLYALQSNNVLSIVERAKSLDVTPIVETSGEVLCSQ
jgi:rhomboid protease GluP